MLPQHADLVRRLQAKFQKMPEAPPFERIDARYYRDQGWFDREMKTLFEGEWLFVGHAAMIPEPGDHFAHDDYGVPLIIMRGEDRKVRAFLNVCRHRGVRVVNKKGCSRQKALVCPYHNWSYNLDGSLKKLPLAESFPNLEKPKMGLVQVPLENHCGVLFAKVTVDPSADPESERFERIEPLVPDFEDLGFASHHFFDVTTTPLKTNWKLIVEAFQDAYHVARLHNKSVGPMFLDSIAIGERVGDHLRALVARKEFAEVGNGPPEAVDLRKHATFAYFIFPNTEVVVHPDYLSFLSLHPKSPNETVAKHHVLILSPPASDEEREHWDRAFKIIDRGVFGGEDYFVCESAQKGIDAGATREMIWGQHEDAIGLFHDVLCERLGEGDRKRMAVFTG